MSKTRIWVGGTVALCLVLSAAGWFLLISPKRADAAELRTQVVEAQSQNGQIATKIAELKVQFAELPQRKAELATIRAAMPADAALAGLTDEVQEQADAAGVVLMTIAPSPPVAIVDPTAVAAPEVDAEGNPVAVADTAAVGDTLASISTVITVVGSFDGASSFVKGIQTALPRNFLVTNLNVVAEEKDAPATGGKPAVKNGDVTLTITGNVFVLRTAQDAADAVAATAPIATTP